MYTSFYGLTKKPFQISSDPAFMWFGEKHKEALATLKYGILDNKGFLLLTGDVGTGKTTLINSLLESLEEDVICTSVTDPGLEKLDFFNYIASSFGIEKEFSTKGTFLVQFRRFLIEASDNNKKVLLIIDEAQLLTQELLEEIRLLSNIEKTDAKLINIFFVGQNEFNEILNREQNRAVRQRLTLNYNIDPLTPDETAEYIAHRLKIAGAKNQIFSQDATQEVFMYSGGFPRRINVICDHSLLSGYVQEKKEINGIIVKDCAKELKIPAYIRNRNINGFSNYRRTPNTYSEPVIPKTDRQTKTQEPETHIYPQDQDQKKSSRHGIWFMLFIILLISIGYFVAFPKDFFIASQIITEKVLLVKNEILTSLNEEPIAVSNVKEPEKNLKNSLPNSSVSDNIKVDPQNKNDKLSLDAADSSNNPQILESSNIHKIQPIQEEILNQEKKGSENAVKGSIHTPIDITDAIDQTTPKENKKHVIHNSIETESVNVSGINSDIKVKKKILPLPEEKVIVRFKYNTNDFTDEGFKKLVDFTDILITHPETEILITGYTDSEGYKKYNRKLSEFRANIVRSFFLGRGIDLDQVRIKGRGSDNPIESNDSAWGRMMNRRVEIEIIK